MKTIVIVLGVSLSILVFSGCREPGDQQSTAEQNEPTTAVTPKKPDQIAVGELYVTDEFALLIPAGWRNMKSLTSGNLKLYLNGDGIGVPAVDETRAPLQIGMTVEKYRNTTDSLAKGIKRLIANAKRSRRLKLVGEAKTESCRLKDGTEAALLTMEFIKEGYRRSLQIKLLAKDSASNGWVVSAFVVGGKDSTIPTADSTVAKLLRAHVTSFCFDSDKVEVSKSADKGSPIE